MQRDVTRERDEVVVAGDEVGVAVDLDEHAGLAVGVDVGLDGALGGLAAAHLEGLVAELHAQQLDGGVDVAVRLGERRLAVHHPGARPVAQLLDLRGGDVLMPSPRSSLRSSVRPSSRAACARASWASPWPPPGAGCPRPATRRPGRPPRSRPGRPRRPRRRPCPRPAAARPRRRRRPRPRPRPCRTRSWWSWPPRRPARPQPGPEPPRRRGLGGRSRLGGRSGLGGRGLRGRRLSLRGRGGVTLGLARGGLLGLLALALLLLAGGALLGLLAGLLLGLLARSLLLGAERLVALRDDVADRLRDDRAGLDRVVVARDHVVDPVRVAVGVDQADDRDPQALGLLDRDDLGLEVDDEHRVGRALHVLDAAEVRLELGQVGLGGHALTRREQRELALRLVALEIVQALDAQRDRLEVRQQAAEPAVVDERHAGVLRDLLDGVARLLLGAHEQHGAAAVGDLGAELLSLLEQRLRLEQVDDVDAPALAVDETAHLGVPAARLVSEMYPGLQQLPDADFGHRSAPLKSGFGTAPGGVGGWADPARAPGRAAVPELPSWDRPGWWSEIAPISLRKFAEAPSFRSCAGRPSLPLPPVVRSVQYREWGGQDGRPAALKDARRGRRGAGSGRRCARP